LPPRICQVLTPADFQTSARYAPTHIAATIPQKTLEMVLIAPELLMLSNGLPPPLPTLPERCDSASAGVRLVLLAELVTVFDDVSTTIAVLDAEVFDVVGGGTATVDFFEVTIVVLVGNDATLESVSIPLVAVGNDESIIVLDPIKAVLLIEIVTGTLALGFASPVVVVTTATLHSNCIAWPILKRPIMLVSSTSASAHAVPTSAFICTKPAKQLFEQVCAEFVKSFTVQPGIVVRYAALQRGGRSYCRGVKSERDTAVDSLVKVRIAMRVVPLE
jgi:hypothetical protein